MDVAEHDKAFAVTLDLTTPEPVHILSLGAGVQSSTLALMAAAGEVTPMPSFAVFADTADEPVAVYTWLDWLEKQLPFPVYRVSRSRLSDHLFEWNHSQIPAFQGGSIGKRQCTKHWKIVPVYKETRARLGWTGKRLPPRCVVMWQGISYDEMGRMRDFTGALGIEPLSTS